MALKNKRVICSDYEKASEKAQPLHTKYKIQQLVTYENIDATQIPYNSHFDVVAFKSILGSISRIGQNDVRQNVFDEIHSALKPNGNLLFAENMTA